MPVEGPLPNVPDAHESNANAKRCFDARCPLNWLSTSLEGTEDYGLDLQIQTTKNRQVSDIFRVQLKGTTTPDVSKDGSFISVEIKATTARYYDRIVEPVLVVLCDLSVNSDPVDCDLYYVWVRDEFNRIDISSLPETQEWVTLRVPTSNRLKGADLSEDIRRHNELARAGHALNAKIAKAIPEADALRGFELVGQVTKTIISSGSALIEALADPGEDYWVNPHPGSTPWHLNRTKEYLDKTNLSMAKAELDIVETLLSKGIPAEKSEYWFLRGKILSEMTSDKEASVAFKKAILESRKGKYVSAWAEAELRHRHSTNYTGGYSDLLADLEDDDPLVLSARSRILAAEERFDEAISVADRIVGSEKHSARALVYMMARDHAGVVSECDFGLNIPNLTKNSRQLLLILKSRALFELAHPPTIDEFGENLPPSGVAGIDAEKLEAAWSAIQYAVDDLRARGWNSNIVHIADIWAACASILGRTKETLPLLIEAANARPGAEVLEEALESIASLCGNFNEALSANSRAPESQKRKLRRVLLLNQAHKHRDCVKHFEENIDSLDRSHPFFGHATVVASMSAYKLVRTDLVTSWLEILNSSPDLKPYAAELEYFMAVDLSKFSKEEATKNFVTKYEELGQPTGMATTVIHALDPYNKDEAERILEVAAKVQARIQPSPSIAMQVGTAMITLNQWNELFDLCQRLEWRADISPRMKGFKALALDQIGKTSEARTTIEGMLAEGATDPMALNMYVSIMVRCGFVSEAISAAEIIMGEATSSRQRKDCIRLLFSLIQSSDPSSPRLLALANEMAALANPNSEAEEGTYLVMFLNATFAEANRPSDNELKLFRGRSEAFFEAFPNSKIIKRGLIREDAPADELISQLKEILGISEEREKFVAKLERDLQDGAKLFPFAWRAQLVFQNIHDVVHLWEISKSSRIDDHKFHLLMCVDPEHKSPTPCWMKEKLPLLDMTALLVLKDLGLIDNLFKMFDQIAIAKSTLQSIARLVAPISGSPMRKQCIELQEALKPHHRQIIQPSANVSSEHEDDAEALGHEYKEIVHLCREQSESYRIYSDDVVIRLLCTRGHASDGLCTLDIMSGMEDLGLLSRKEVAEKIADLCQWRVGIIVRYDDLSALFPIDFLQAHTVKDAVAAIDADQNFSSVISAIWNFRAPFEKTLGHASHVLRRITDSTEIGLIPATALARQWYAKVGFAKDAPRADAVLINLIIGAAQIGPLSSLSSRRLVGIYLKMVELDSHPYMDEQKEREAIAKLAAYCASLQIQNAQAGQIAFKGLQLAFTADTKDYEIFTSSYSDALIVRQGK
jgi:tetratricopeptide (TPR) repeat protein